MNRTGLLWGLATVCAVLLALVWGRWRLQQTASELAAAEAAFEQSVADVQELRRLQGRRSILPSASAADADLLSEWQAAIRAVGLPVESTLADIQPLGQRTSGSDAVPWETIRLNLQGLRVSDLGRIIASWQDEPSPWRITDLQINHQRATGRAARGNRPADASYRCTLTLAAPVIGH